MNLPFRDIARNVNVSVGTVHNIFTTLLHTGDVTSRTRPRSDLRVLTSLEEMFIIGLVLNNPCLYLYLQELGYQVQEVCGKSVSPQLYAGCYTGMV